MKKYLIYPIAAIILLAICNNAKADDDEKMANIINKIFLFADNVKEPRLVCFEYDVSLANYFPDSQIGITDSCSVAIITSGKNKLYYESNGILTISEVYDVGIISFYNNKFKFDIESMMRTGIMLRASLLSMGVN